MKLKPPLNTLRSLPDSLKDLDGRYFTSRHAATHAEAEERKDVIFGVKSLKDLLERTKRQKPKAS